MTRRKRSLVELPQNLHSSRSGCLRRPFKANTTVGFIVDQVALQRPSTGLHIHQLSSTPNDITAAITVKRSDSRFMLQEAFPPHCLKFSPSSTLNPAMVRMSLFDPSLSGTEASGFRHAETL
ncbi:hypothetical protein [Synechococcus sp. MIT S1220]|uniref:hypothetical protein n=1 Tax=Synechococcus sp. MIT S1220 TaxID=3082549 RepID=UPI0039B081A4